MRAHATGIRNLNVAALLLQSRTGRSGTAVLSMGVTVTESLKTVIFAPSDSRQDIVALMSSGSWNALFPVQEITVSLSERAEQIRTL